MGVPKSPGPLPVKHNMEAEARERQAEEAAIVPDSNPLAPQSPAPTYASHSAPPHRTNGRGISAVPDIQCHTPGQAFHPQQGGSAAWVYGAHVFSMDGHNTASLGNQNDKTRLTCLGMRPATLHVRPWLYYVDVNGYWQPFSTHGSDGHIASLVE
ncbi:hypothetical protein McanCB49686_006212 [Microsporum canis]